MSTIYLSKQANPILKRYLINLGHHLEMVEASPLLTSVIQSHPDLFLCKMGSHPKAPVFRGDLLKPCKPYPHDSVYNAACTGKYFFHHLKITDDALLHSAVNEGMIPIHVKQGYTKCNVVVVDETAIITSDRGIHKIASKLPDFSCLLVSAGYVALPGYQTGFLGGASGRVSDQIVFHGALNRHPDFYEIRRFIQSRRLETIWFEEFELTDIGSIIEVKGPQ